MKKIILILALIVTIQLLNAQQSLRSSIDQSLSYLEIMPEDLSEHLSLAYLYMLNNTPDSAQVEYKKVVDRDSTNLEAWVGYLWAKSVIDDNEGILKEEKRALNLTKNNPSLLLFMGSASINLYNTHSARYYYQKALNDSTIGLFDKFYATKGLGMSYYWLNDYYRYKKINNQLNKDLPDSLKTDLIPMKPFYYSGMFYGKSGEKTDYEGFEQLINYGAVDYNFIIEHFRKDSKSVRTNYTFRTENRYFPVTIATQFHFLDGKTPYYYDAKIYQIALSKVMYLYKFKYEPYTAYTYSDYSNFSTNQIDYGIQFTSHKINLTLLNSMISYKDYPAYTLVYPKDKVKDDFKHLYVSLLYKASDMFNLELTNGFGNQSFWVSPTAYVVDTNQGCDQFHQSTVYFFFDHMILSSYYKLSHKNDHWVGSGLMSIGFKY